MLELEETSGDPPVQLPAKAAPYSSLQRTASRWVLNLPRGDSTTCLGRGEDSDILDSFLFIFFPATLSSCRLFPGIFLVSLVLSASQWWGENRHAKTALRSTILRRLLPITKKRLSSLLCIKYSHKPFNLQIEMIEKSIIWVNNNPLQYLLNDLVHQTFPEAFLFICIWYDLHIPCCKTQRGRQALLLQAGSTRSWSSKKLTIFSSHHGQWELKVFCTHKKLLASSGHYAVLHCNASVDNSCIFSPFHTPFFFPCLNNMCSSDTFFIKINNGTMLLQILKRQRNVGTEKEGKYLNFKPKDYFGSQRKQKQFSGWYP